MPRRLSCSMTVDSVLDRSKTVTRRHPTRWLHLAPGDRLTLIEKGMGLPKGAKQVVLAEVEVVSNRIETLREVDAAEVKAEGLWDRAVTDSKPYADHIDPEVLPVQWFRAFWASTHHFGTFESWMVGPLSRLIMGVECRRISWRYLDEERP